MIRNSYVVFDRDGTLIEYIPYLKDSINVNLSNGAKSLIKNLLNNNNKIFLHTNQSGVERGFFDLNTVKECNDRLIDLLGIKRNIFEKICIATELKDSINSYRKPSPKFGLEIQKEFSIKPSNMYYIGDNLTDLETAYNLGCKAFGIINKGIEKNVMGNQFKFPVFESLNELNQFIYGI